MNLQDTGFDYPSRQEDGFRRNILLSINGKASVIESGIEHRTGNYLTSVLVYDTVGYCVFSETDDLPKECQMAYEVQTLERNADGLPRVIRKNQLGENLTQGLTRLFVEQVTGDKRQELKILSQQQIVLEWNENNRLQSSTTYQLAQYQENNEFWMPEQTEYFKYDDQGRLVEEIREQYDKNGHHIEYFYTYQHDKVKGFNRVVSSWYTNNDIDNKNANQLELHTVNAIIFDPKTRERLLFIGYSNVQITPKIPILGSSKPIFAIKADYGDHLAINMDDLQKLISDNNISAMKCIEQKLVPLEMNVPTRMDLSQI